MNSTSHKFTNRLAAETSPYLLQHAHNPVDWHPWGPKAFELARKTNRPIFLSVGYSTCYWCHVMERQCFENEAIAELMNRLCVNIKVDREQRPDVDQLYMLALQIMTRQGGWPMSVFLTPDLRPFFAGTYFPPQDGHGRPGFPRVLQSVATTFQQRPEQIERSAESVVDILRQLAEPQPTQRAFSIDQSWLNEMIQRCTADFDADRGGFGTAPKFPRETLLDLLLAFLAGNSDVKITAMLRRSLEAMAHGGIRDHLGGAFHRYSTDAEWLIPHFEIMLYDNAMLAWIYSEASRQMNDPRFAIVARGILDFVLLELTSPTGAFYTAIDAEVDAQEGGSYLWTKAQVEDALKDAATPEEIARFCRAYGLDWGPNFRDPHGDHDAPHANVLFLAQPGNFEDSALLNPEYQRLCKALYEVRRKRKQPMLDTKILVSWNALMIRAMAIAGRVLDEPRYSQAAVKAAEDLTAHHTPRNLDDHAYLAWAMLALDRPDDARKLMEQIQQKFGGGNTGGFFYTDSSATDLIVRQKTSGDNPLPNANAVAALVLLELGDSKAAADILQAFAGSMDRTGEECSAMIQAAMQHVGLNGSLEITANVTATQHPKSLQEMAKGVVKTSTNWANPTELKIQIEIQPGYHVQADHVQLAVASAPDGVRLQLPEPITRRFQFSDEPVMVYEKEFDLSVFFTKPLPSGEELEFVLSYQACNEEACLPTARLTISITTP